MKEAAPVRIASTRRLYFVYERSKANVSLTRGLGGSMGSSSSSMASMFAKSLAEWGREAMSKLRAVVSSRGGVLLLETHFRPAEMVGGKTRVRKRPRTKQLREIR